MRRTGSKRRRIRSGKKGKTMRRKPRSGYFLSGRKRSASVHRRGNGAKQPIRRISRKPLWLKQAEEAGRQSAKLYGGSPNILQLNHAWNASPLSGLFSTMSRLEYLQASKRFLTGFEQGSGRSLPQWVLLPTTKTISAIITAMNEEDTLAVVLNELDRLPIAERIVIVNGSHDNSFIKARENNDTTVVHFPDKLGHDVGRGVGAKMSQSDILLFMDGDFVIQAEELVPFIHQLIKGTDVALNDITPLLPPFSQRDDVTVLKQFLNCAMGKPQLHANSLTAIPHAMTREAVDIIGYSNLSVPPKAQWLAVSQGLKVSAAHCVDVISGNKLRAGNEGRGSKVSDLIVGDHLEALALAMNHYGRRLHYPDAIRKRELVGGVRS